MTNDTYFKLSEAQQYNIERASCVLKLLSDLVDAIPDQRTIHIDPRGLSILLDTVQHQLPTGQDMPFINKTSPA